MGPAHRRRAPRGLLHPVLRLRPGARRHGGGRRGPPRDAGGGAVGTLRVPRPLQPSRPAARRGDRAVVRHGCAGGVVVSPASSPSTLATRSMRSRSPTSCRSARTGGTSCTRRGGDSERRGAPPRLRRRRPACADRRSSRTTSCAGPPRWWHGAPCPWRGWRSRSVDDGLEAVGGPGQHRCPRGRTRSRAAPGRGGMGGGRRGRNPVERAKPPTPSPSHAPEPPPRSIGRWTTTR